MGKSSKIALRHAENVPLRARRFKRSLSIYYIDVQRDTAIYYSETNHCNGEKIRMPQCFNFSSAMLCKAKKTELYEEAFKDITTERLLRKNPDL